MQLGLIGLGRMGSNMATRLLAAGHRLVVHDVNADAATPLVQSGATAASSLDDLVGQLSPPRQLWVMVPEGHATQSTIESLTPLLDANDIIVDGGNSLYKDSMQRADALRAQGVHYVDVGTSGGIWGLREGYSLMVGGDVVAVERLRPVFESLAPAPDRGWAHVGPSGAGHFVKMIHNGIEYGLMQAYAEGFAVMRAKRELDLDLSAIAEVWRHGSVVRSWLLDLTADILEKGTDLSDVAPHVPDSGEGRWTVAEAIDLDVPAPVMTLALIQRLRSRDTDSWADRLLAAMRREFGGHAVMPPD
ncbi:decarboxylating 6-phosphogluconate dehydrogenase [soil metagenome]